MSDRYNQIKNIFSIVFEKPQIPDIKINNYPTISQYIKGVYEHIQKSYGDMRIGAINFLGVSYTELDNLFMESICSNLYCDITLIRQILSGKGIRHEYYLSNLGIYGTENKKLADRFRKSLNPNRLNDGKIKVSLPSRNEDYYTPTLSNLFKETLFIKRGDTYDISEAFIDIFKSLFIASDEDAEDSLRSKNIRLLKSYRTWQYTTETLEQEVCIYKEIFEGKSKCKYAELNFIEKLFSVITISELVSRNFPESELCKIAESISGLRMLGYSKLTELIISKVTPKNCGTFSDFVDEYVYPLCTDCITTILRDVILYIGRIEESKRVDFTDGILKSCHNNITYKIPISKVEDAIEANPSQMLVAFKTIHLVPHSDNTESLLCYLVEHMSTTNRTEPTQNGTLDYVDWSYNDISYLRPTTPPYTVCYEVPTDEDFYSLTLRFPPRK